MGAVRETEYIKDAKYEWKQSERETEKMRKFLVLRHNPKHKRKKEEEENLICKDERRVGIRTKGRNKKKISIEKILMMKNSLHKREKTIWE